MRSTDGNDQYRMRPSEAELAAATRTLYLVAMKQGWLPENTADRFELLEPAALEEIRVVARQVLIAAVAAEIGESAKPYMAELAKRSKDERGRLIPPWLMFPDIPHGSIGWRMGSGESHAMSFYEMFSALSESERRAYVQDYPEPPDWSGHYAAIVADPGLA